MSTGKKTADSRPLPLSDMLQDLAILRASDIDLAATLRVPTVSSPASSPNDEVEMSLKQSYDYVREARAALRVLHTGRADREGERVDAVRSELEEVVAGLAGNGAS